MREFRPNIPARRPAARPCLRRVLAVLLLWSTAAGAAPTLEPVPVAPGVYAFMGANAEAAPDNEGNVGNSGFIVGDTGVLVVDTGGSRAHGEAMLAAIAKITAKPVELVVITHAVQDFVFGAAAFSERGIALLAHRRTLELMKARCAHCLENLRRVLGDAPLQGTRLVLPGRIIDVDTRLRFAGRDIELIYPGWASTPGDLMVLDRATRTLFAGGIVTAARVPELRDGDQDGWLRALEALRVIDPAHIVPGYGPLQPAHEAQANAGYLRALDVRMRALYASGMGLTEAIDAADMADYQSWALYPEQHRRNALRRYLQLEVEDLEHQ